MPFYRVAADQLLWCFTRIKYPTLKEPTLNDTISVVDTITSSDPIMECFKRLCCQWINKDAKLANKNQWQVLVACDRKTLMNCSTLVNAIQHFVSHLVREPLTRIVYFVQNESALTALTVNETQQECLKLLFIPTLFSMDNIPEPQAAESLVVDTSHLELIYPFSYLFFKRVDCLKEFFLDEYRRQCHLDENVDDDGELTESARKSLIIRVARKVEQVIPEMVESGYLVSYIQDYLDDVLDIKTEEFSHHLSRQNRIIILKAHFLDHFPDTTQTEKSVPKIVAQLHSLFWIEEHNEYSVTCLLNYVKACMPLLQITVDKVVKSFVDKRTTASEDGDADQKGDTDKLTFVTYLSEKICTCLLPTDVVVHKAGGIESWKNLTRFVLSASIKFGVQGKAFHFLKVCNDFSTLLNSVSKTRALYALGEIGMVLKEKGEDFLDSTRTFDLICDFIKDLRKEDEDEERLDEFLFLFYGRCLESNPYTPLMGDILKQISSTKNKRLLELSAPILCRIFRIEETAFSPKYFGTIFDSLEDLKDFPNLIKVNVALCELQESGIELDCHFNVICSDQINRIAFKDLNLKKVCSSDNHILQNFHKAGKILSTFDENNKCNGVLRFLCSVSYLRAVVSALARFLMEFRHTMVGEKHRLMLRDILKDLNEKLPSRMGSLSLLLLKELRQRLSTYEVRELVDSCEILHFLKTFVCSDSTCPRKIDYDPFQIQTEKSEVEIALNKYIEFHDSKSLDDIVSNISLNEDKMKLAAVAFEQFYLVRTVRNLKDTEDKAAQYLLENLASVPHPYKSFLCRIANQERFECSELEINPESKAIDVEVAVLVQHLSAIITSRYTENTRNPVVCCVVDPTEMKDSYILAAPNDSSGYRCYKYFETTKRENAFFSVCSACCTRFTTREDKSTMECPNCRCSCERKIIKRRVLMPEQQMGYIYCKPEEMKEEMLCTRSLNPVEFRILHLIIHVALFAGYSLKLTTSKLAEFMKVDNPSELCLQYIQIDLDVLCATFVCSKDRIVAFMQQILKEATPMLTEDSGVLLPHDDKTRLSWESYFSTLVRPLVQKLSKPTPRSKHVDGEDKDDKTLETQIKEIEEPHFPDVSARNLCLPRLFRIKKHNSFEKLKEFYLNSSDEVKNKHQLLGLFLDYHKSLGLIGNLVALNTWSRRVDALLSRSLSRVEAKTRKIGDAVIGKELQRNQVDGEKVETNSIVQAFEKFTKAWENAVHLFNDNMDDNKYISEINPVGLCLVETQDLGRYLCETLVGLAKLQNEFLDKCLTIAASENCLALQFLCKGGTTFSFPAVHVQDAREKEIIGYEWTDDFLDHSRYNLEYGCGTEIIYDLERIEKDMAGCFLLGKAYLTTSKGMREFVFSKQLFHDCANILNDLEHAIPQEKLPSNVETELSGAVAKSMDNIQVLLEHMEIILCFLKRTGGKPEESLLDYVKTWMTASRPFPKELLKSQTAIQLRHVCALYEFLEDKLAAKAIGCVGDEYRKILSEDFKVEMDNSKVLQDESCSQRILFATLTALLRFVFRYLSMKPATNICLVECMEDPSLWPMSARTKQGHEFELTEIVPALFPKMLTIAHVFEVHKYYQGRLNELNPKKKQTNSSFSVAPRSRQTTSRTRDKRRKQQGVGKGFS